MSDDPALDPHLFDDPSLLGDEGLLSEENLRPFLVALGGLLVAVAVATLLTLLSYPLGKRFAHRHPVMAEMLNVGRR